MTVLHLSILVVCAVASCASRRNKTILMLVCTLNLLFISPQFSPLIHCAKNLTVSAGTKEIDCEVPEWCTQVGNEH